MTVGEQAASAATHVNAPVKTSFTTSTVPRHQGAPRYRTAVTCPMSRTMAFMTHPRTPEPLEGTVVLDTCVLLADPLALDAFPGRNVVVPLTVVEELDAHKSRLDDLGRSARQAVRRLEELRCSAGGSLQHPVPLPGGGSMRIELNGLRTDRLREAGLDTSKSDNRILAAALGLREKEEDVEVVSSDVNMRVKASALGLPARDWVPQGLRDSVPDGWRSVEVESDMVDQVYSSGKVKAPPSWELQPNEFVVLRNGSQSALTRHLSGSLARVPRELRAWGLAPRSKEQMFALDLLMDPGVPVVSLSGAAGTGKTVLALAAGLEQVFEPSSRRPPFRNR